MEHTTLFFLLILFLIPNQVFASEPQFFVESTVDKAPNGIDFKLDITRYNLDERYDIFVEYENELILEMYGRNPQSDTFPHWTDSLESIPTADNPVSFLIVTKSGSVEGITPSEEFPMIQFITTKGDVNEREITRTVIVPEFPFVYLILLLSLLPVMIYGRKYGGMIGK